MSEVYAARDLLTDAKVAVKLLTAGHLDAGILRESFEREVRSLGQLRHPSIVNLLDQGEDPETRTPFIVLDWVDSDLSSFLQSSRFESWDHLYPLLLRPLLEGLSEAHSRGISHRDVKPSNILVDSAGSPRLTDFGISKLKSYLFPSHTLNQFMSPPYAPPELDDGAYTYTRDIYALTAVAIECLSGAKLTEHKDLISALDGASLPILIHSILKRAVSNDPARRQANAAVLLAELEAAQEQRGINAEPRIDIFLDLAQPAITQLLKLFPEKSRDEATAILLSDLNLVCGIGSSESANGRPSLKLYGGSFICDVSFAIPSADHLMINSLSKVSPSITEKRRERALQLNIRFRPGKPSQGQASEAPLYLRERLEAFRLELTVRDSQAQQNDLFRTWGAILRAKHALEKTKENPIRYKGYSVQGNRIIFEVEGKIPGELLDQPRLVKDDALVKVTGHVESTSDSQLVMQVDRWYTRELARTGIVSIDIEAARLAIERQNSALQAVRYRRSVRSDLGDLLVFPEQSRLLKHTADVTPILSELDEPKRDAVLAAMNAQDFLVVEGPPGTGKTTFITEMILQILRENPARRILLTSQTHVALDNALEQLLTTNAQYRTVRLGRSGNPKISRGVDELLLDSQMGQWRDEVIRRGTVFLEDFAKQHGITHEQVQIGMGFEKLAQIQRELEDLDVRKTLLEAQLKEHENKVAQKKTPLVPGKDEKTDALLEKYGAASDELTKVRTEMRLKTSERDEVRSLLRKLEPDTASLVNLSTDDLRGWAELYLPSTPEYSRVRAVFTTQAEWQARFGRTADFAPALLRSAQIVAGTCVGVAGIKGVQDIDFDVCIVDEASKATPTEMLIPLSRSRKWIVVGDQKQLPPFVDEGFRDASILQEFGLDEDSIKRTIFDRLHDMLPADCKKMLSIQYRMVPAIGNLISHCFYDDTLKSAEKEWDRLLQPILPTPVVWLSTSKKANRFETKTGDSYWNEAELQIVHDTLKSINARAAIGNKVLTIAVLTGYGLQRSIMERRFASTLKTCTNIEVEWNTVDAVQGRQADIVIYSVTRSNQLGKIGFLKETSRLNVALSRCKQNLILVGDHVFFSNVSGENPFKRVLRYIEQHSQDCTIVEVDS
ncbi:serine/threonine-protein kinase [Granulicella sp. dw_53]|uniref:serine/threonine-protein kinase n=1 Tax=Granulicella sp. dw_53 TaxID=2719792 RepID=UPI001BD655C4|nr:serine/threonine-protein kinase [Granulicella sp. dw_53]